MGSVQLLNELNDILKMKSYFYRTLGLPLGLALHFSMNGRERLVPMAVEEPSVIAAISGAAKTIKTHSLDGGFVASGPERNMIIGQVLLAGFKTRAEVESAQEKIRECRAMLIDKTNEFCLRMKKRGGGSVDVTSRILNDRLMTVHIHIDTCEAMGANTASSVAEGVAPLLQKITGARIGPQIVTNLSPERLVKSRFRLPVDKLAYKGFQGLDVAQRIIEANEWAELDVYRASTHNKGIMNGIDAVAIATGQDWRAIEAAAHVWSHSQGKSYGPFTQYWLEENDSIFTAELDLPLCVGTKGGSVVTNPGCQLALEILGSPTSKELAQVMVSIGLAQNFAAMRALVTEGIQKGHMSLHARNVAMAAGAPSHATTECVEYMISCGRIHEGAAKEYLEAHEILQRVSLASGSRLESPLSPSTLSFTHGDVSLNIAFASVRETVHMELLSGTVHPLVDTLFGHKSGGWLCDTLVLLDGIRLRALRPLRANIILSKKLKIISILIHLLTRQLVIGGISFRLPWLESDDDKPDNLIGEPLVFSIGRVLLKSLWQVFVYRTEQWVGHDPLRNKLLEEQKSVLLDLCGKIPEGLSPKDALSALMALHARRFQVRVFLLMDAISLDSSDLTEQRLESLLRLGQRLEREQSVAHDLGRFERDKAAVLLNGRGLSMDGSLAHGRVLNGHLCWLSMSGSAQRKMEDWTLGSTSGFLLAVKSDNDLDDDETLFRTAVQRVREHYRVTSLFSRGPEYNI